MRIASKATKGKGRRWKRGTSSSCNPSNKKHRLLSKCLPQSQQSNQLKLTQDLISHYDSIQFQKLRLDNNSVGNKSIDLKDISEENLSETESIGKASFASVWTNCSNVSFNKLLYGFESSSAIQKQMLSILAAITETIHSNGGKESETEYFAALMTCLESVQNEESLTAIISLLQMVIKRLPPNVIRLKFSDTSKVLVEYLAKYIKGENGLLVRSLTNCIATILQHQEYAIWELSSTQHIFESILSLTIHNKPRIRKTAHKAIARILRSDINQSKTSLCHPIAKLTADFCIRKIEENGVNDNLNLTLYILSLMNDIMPVLPHSSLKKSCESILTLMTFGNVLIVSSSFKAFYTLFAAEPHEELLTPELNAKLISALYDYQPNINDSQPLCAWFSALKQAFVNLNRINKRLCFNHLPKLFNVSVSCLLSDSREVHLCVANNLKQIYTDCIEKWAQIMDKEIIEKIYSSLENALKYQYCNAWFSILSLIPHMFNAYFSDYCCDIIKKLTVIRESYDCVYAADIDRAIGHAVQVFGPKYVVNLSQLNLNEEKSDVSHNWLLPVLRDNVKNTEMSFFIEYFVPMASLLQKSSKILESEGNSTTAKTCSILVSQIWSLLPSFCIKPNDFDKSFKKIAKTLGSILSDDHLLRGYVLTAIRNIAKSFDEEPVRTELSRFSKNFIPILFNIYTSEPKLDIETNQRFSIYEVIQLFFSISENSLLISLFSKVKEKLNDCNNDDFMKHSLLDLIRAFVPYVREADIEEIYTSLVIPYMNNNKLITEQKKSFRIIEEICRSDSKSCLNFLEDKLIDILNLLVDTFSKCLSSSKSYALKALKLIIEKHSNNNSIDWKNLFLQIIPKALDCLLINSQKVKTAAFELIICLSNAFKLLNNGKNTDFVELMISFLNKNEYSSAAVIMSLNRLYSELRNEVPKHIECDLVENIISSLRSNNRQTIQASIDFLKTFFRTASADQLSSYLEILINNLSNINPQHQKHFRIKIREIFVRLVRKYG
jgi:ribosomal RNA-processing protein 12